MAGTVAAINTIITMRPPYLSVQMPSGTRISEPVNTGMAVSSPNSVALSPKVFFNGMPMTPNIIHTMKQTVNANVLTISTDHAWRWMGEVTVTMDPTRLGFDETVRPPEAGEHPPCG